MKERSKHSDRPKFMAEYWKISDPQLSMIIPMPKDDHMEDRTGRRVENWLILGYVGRAKYKTSLWLCLCNCGQRKILSTCNLNPDQVKRCGCWVNPRRKTEKSKRRSRIKKTYNAMIRRCYCESSDSYVYWGARGIKVCDDWLSNFESFYTWAISSNYGDNLSIERINVNGDYCPENCCWITMAEQNKNKQRHIYLTAFGETKKCTEWAKDPRCAVRLGTIRQRMVVWNNGDEIISKPSKQDKSCVEK